MPVSDGRPYRQNRTDGAGAEPGYLDAGDEWSSPPTQSAPPPTAPTPEPPAQAGWRPAPGNPATAMAPAGPAREAPGAPDDRVGTGRVQGVARNVPLRYDMGQSQDVLSFRVDQYDPSGNRLQPVPVELRGYQLRGQISEGEEVSVSGEWQRGTLVARQLTNVTTRADVRTSSWADLSTLAKSLIIGIPVAIIVGIIATVVVVLLVTGGSDDSVPNVVGKDAFFARSDVEDRGLVPQETTEASDSMPEGRVIRTEPPVGSKPGKGAVVTVVVSSGSATMTLPNVVGKPWNFAFSDLASAGFQPQTVEENSATVPVNSVIRTDPAPGSTVKRNAAVTVVVSRGPRR